MGSAASYLRAGARRVNVALERTANNRPAILSRARDSGADSLRRTEI
jgi:hypothetical protein